MTERERAEKQIPHGEGPRRKDVILVIDMQNAYRPGQKWGCATFRRTCQNIRALLSAVETCCPPPPVYFTKFRGNPHGAGVWADYNRVNRKINEDRWMNELVEDLSDAAARYPVLEKSVYSSLSIPALREAVRAGDRLVVTGVISECCVLSTCMEAIDLGLHVLYLRDACGGGTVSMEEAVEKILSRLSPLHVTLADTAEYLNRRES